MTVASALVLGGSGGIGSAITRRLAELCPVTIGYAERPDRAAALVDQLRPRTTTRPHAIEAMASANAMRRLGTPDDVAGAVMMLCAPDAGWVTGAVVDASGGLW